ncbi:MAG: ABC transporter permease [Chloroflexi bacterium]|nr:ABC transporter permease [Chloroflexota bacterium]
MVCGLWQHRFLLQQMIRRDIGQRYRGSYMGMLWSLINPLIMLLIYTFVFSVVFNARWRPTDEVVPLGEFAITLFAGLIPFNLFSEVVNRSPGIIFSYPNYVKKVIFPLEILPVMITGTALFTSFVSLVILTLASWVFMHVFSPTMIFLPLIYIPLVLLSLGLGWILASLGVYIRDIGQAIPLVVQVLLFVSPIFYSTSSVPEQYRAIIMINPLTMIVNDFRQLLLWGQFFPVKEWLVWTIISGFIAVVGYVWFMATKKGFADVM